ncbi:NAD(P)H-binding protein [Shewanella sp. SG41-4]|uniref:NAD(P)-dependent oxidoreductase n=1 Tax=Shewanella sp. SG41-4 TaxID=2760976 RepID=UPI001601D37D|nr:NAD(P)H-binding protein [Shewanella sp. SG41-4]MBB1438985.1 NAD(P)H-binding protein [Shewanella sp. SG41-4]
MKITIFGAAGEVGSRVVSEALHRGHEVTAVVRNPTQFSMLPQGVIQRTGDAGIINDVVQLSSGQDLVISAVRPPAGDEALLAPITKSILIGVAKSNVRLLVVGGAASLKLPGQGDISVLTAPNFLPKEVINIARACFFQHEICIADKNADWAYLSPPAVLIPGTRTGKYRLGSNELIFDRNGVSQISMEDFAVVLLDEAEQPKHQRTRFTTAY